MRKMDVTGQDLLQDFLSVLAAPQSEADAARRWIDRQFLWMAQALEGDGGARSINRLSRGRPEAVEFRALLDAVSSGQILDAYLKTVGSYFEDAPLRVKLGIYDQPKQGLATQDVWDGVMPRGQFRPYEPAESHRLFLIVSKILGGPVVFPGPTEVVQTKSTPDEAVKQLLERLARLTGEGGAAVEIVGLEQIDEFDAALSAYGLHAAARLPFAYRLPRLMKEVGLAAPAAFKLPPVQGLLSPPLVHGMSVDGLRVKQRVADWGEVAASEIAGRAYRFRASPQMRLSVEPPGAPFSGRLVHVEDITPQEQRGGRPLETYKLVAVVGARDPAHAGELAVAVMSALDGDPAIRAFIERRKLTRVLRGEFQNHHTLASDRAFAAVALAARQLEDSGAAIGAQRS
jgi:hypothetical protein